MFDDIRTLIKLRENKERLQTALTEVNKAISSLEESICNKFILEDGVSSIKLDDMTVSFSRKLYASICGGVTTTLAKNAENFYYACTRNNVDLPSRTILTFTQTEINNAVSQLPDSAVEGLVNEKIISIYLKPEIKIRGKQ